MQIEDTMLTRSEEIFLIKSGFLSLDDLLKVRDALMILERYDLCSELYQEVNAELERRTQ